MPDNGLLVTVGAVLLLIVLTYLWKRNEWFPSQRSISSAYVEGKVEKKIVVDSTGGTNKATEAPKNTPAPAAGPTRSSQNTGSSARVAVAMTVLVCAILFGGIYYVLSGTSSGTQAATPATADVGDCLPDELFVMAPAKGDKFSDPISVWTDKPYPHVMRNDFNPNADVLFRMSDKSTQVAHKDGGVNLGYTKTFEFQSLDENEVGVVIHIWRCK